MDLFLAADFTFPEKVVAAGLADAKAPMPYARGHAGAVGAEGLAAAADLDQNTLTDPRVQKLAIADPLHAPYGRAAWRR